MKCFALFAAAAATALAAPLAAADGAEGHPWGYLTTNASVATPSQWPEYFEACGGDRQSPIDISTKSCSGATDDSPFTFDGECSDYTLTQSHEAYKGSVVGGSCSVSTDDAAYDLLQFHVHTPSEHTLNGKAMDGEAHFVHSNEDSSALLVVGLFFQASDTAETDPFFTDLLDGIDAVTEETPVNITLSSYSDLLASSGAGSHLFNYPGSLTTPACSEIVDWWVIQKPLKIATEDLARLAEHFAEFAIYDEGKNARPVQPLNGRTVTTYLV